MSDRAFRFSTRLDWDLRPNRISKLLSEKSAGGSDLLDLTESNPTKAGFVQNPAEVHSAMTDPATLVYSPEPRGHRSAREAVADYHTAHYAEIGTPVKPDQIFLTASTSEAYSFLFKLLGDSGDEVLIPQPSYPLFEFLVRLEKLEVRNYPLVWNGTWQLSPDTIRERIGDRTRAIVVVNPNNPTGSFLKRDELDRLAEVCAERRIALISDEVFFDFALDASAERVSVASYSGRVLSFTLSGLSKVVGLPQMKLSWIVVSGPDEIRTAAMEGIELIADTYLSVGAAVQHGATRLLAMRGRYQAGVLARTSANLAHLREASAGRECAPLAVEGGWYAVLRLSDRLDEETLVLDLLAADDVLVQPGYFYDFPFPCVVVSLLTRPDAFQEGIARLLRRLAS